MSHRKSKGDTREIATFEDEILAELSDIPFSVSAIRVRVEQAMIRFPKTEDLLDPVSNELDNIERRARAATAASARFHRERWR